MRTSLSDAARATSASSSTDGVAAPPCRKICWPDAIDATASPAETMRINREP
jgi:hypothetical protein